MICAVCQRDEAEDGQVCDRDRVRLRNTLADVAHLYGELPDALATGGTGGPKVSGTREAPLPVNVDVLDLLAGARVANVHDIWRDQTGHVGVAAALDLWVRDWIDTRAKGETRPLPTVPVLRHWLDVRLDWACDEHPAIDDFATEIGRLRSVLRGTLGDTDPKPQAADRPCPSCNWLSLYHRPGTDYIDCTNPDCRATMTKAEYGDRLRDIAKAAVRHAA